MPASTPTSLTTPVTPTSYTWRPCDTLAGPTPEEERAIFIAAMRRACGWLTDVPLIVGPGAASRLMLAFPGDGALLESRAGYKLLWRVSQLARVIPPASDLKPWRVMTEEYIYELRLVGGGEV